MLEKTEEILNEINAELEENPIDISTKIIENVPISQIEIESEREKLGDLDLLKASIKKYGLINPVLLLRIGDNRYKKIAGYRRIKAFEELGKERIPAIVVLENEMDNITKAHLLTYYENIARENLNVVEKTNLFLLSLYDFAKDIFPENSFENLKETLQREINDFNDLPLIEQKKLIARKVFAFLYSLEKRNIDHLNATEAQIKQKWITFRENFGFFNVETIRKNIKISTLTEPLLSFVKENIINKDYALKAVKISLFPNTYNKMIMKLNLLYQNFKEEKIDFENFCEKVKETIDYYYDKKEFENFNDNEELIKKNSELISFFKIIEKDISKKIKQNLLEEEKINQVMEMLNKIDEIISKEEL